MQEKLLDELRLLCDTKAQKHVEFSMYMQDSKDPEVRSYRAKEVRRMNKRLAVLQGKIENGGC